MLVIEFQEMPEPKDPERLESADVVRASSRYFGHGMALAAAVALFGWIGSEIGERIGAHAALTLLGMALGGAAGFYSIYLQLVIRPRVERERDSKRSGKD